MQQTASSRLSWSDVHQVYELSDARTGMILRMTAEDSTWFAWLEEASSFAFHGQSGHFTARKETKQRGDVYWYAYRKMKGKLAKKYLGKTADLTLAYLETAAGALQADRSTAVVTRDPAPLAPRLDHPGPIDVSNQPGDAFSPLLSTKLHLPRPRFYLVAREHLVARLQEGTAGTLTLISAPAGFGKTTLLAQWLAAMRAPAAWLSLEPQDNDPTRFLTYLIVALQTLDRDMGAPALALLRRPQPAEHQTVLTLLTNDLMNWQGETFVLVLDDYHVIDAMPIHAALAFLLEHLPPQMHLVIATRADPPLPLARLRARGQLTELRAAELRFGAAESSAFLEAVMGLHLAPDDVATIQARTEGWIAGLQLAALALQGTLSLKDHDNAPEFLAAFKGSHRFVLDYLSEEVLARQTPDVQTFLLYTSILERLSGPLCDAVTGQVDSQAMLEALERANLFVVALDDERHWYRYHHLFADILHSRLQQTAPTLIPELHRRASTWYEQHDLMVEAVHHAFLAPDVERPIHLIEQYSHAVTLRGEIQTVLNWLNAVPDDLARTHPRLGVSHAMLLMFAGQLEIAKGRLDAAEQSASQNVPAGEAPFVLNMIATMRAYLRYLEGDLITSVAWAEQVLDRLSEPELHAREAASMIVAHRFLVSGDIRLLSEQSLSLPVSPYAVERDLSAHGVFAQLVTMLAQAQRRRLQGRLKEAAAMYEQVAQVQHDQAAALVPSGYCFGLGELCYEWNDLDAAERLLEQGIGALRGPLTPAADLIVQGYYSLARLRQARQDHPGALSALDAFIHLAHERQFAAVQVAQAAAGRAQIALIQGNLAAAVHWADTSGISPADELAYPREREFLTFVRVRLGQGREDPEGPRLTEALYLLERLFQDAESKARLGSLLEILILQALAFSARGQETEALGVLQRALTLAEPEGYLRLFVDEGALMRQLLRRARAQGVARDYVRMLLTVWDSPNLPGMAVPVKGAFIEPLTEREREVLRLLLEGASNREIADQLVLSVNTVKKHVFNICGKLEVQSRAQAMVKARTLNLF